MPKQTIELPVHLVEQLQGEKLVFVVTLTPSQDIYTTAISWLAAADGQRIRFAISPKSPVLQNIKERADIQLLVTLPENVLAIKGKARMVTDAIPDVPFPMACIEVSVDEYHDIMFYGGRLVREPKYEKTYSKDLSVKLDTAIYRYLRAPSNEEE